MIQDLDQHAHNIVHILKGNDRMVASRHYNGWAVLAEMDAGL